MVYLLLAYSKDMDEIDLMIPTHLKDILSDLFSVLGTLFVVCYATPIIIAIVIPLIFVFFFIQTSYLSTSRQLKRMLNVARSPINSRYLSLSVIFLPWP